MKIKIAAFGRGETIHLLQSFIKDDESIEMVPMIYSTAKEAPDLIDQAFMCDIYLFTEALPYFYAKEKIELRRLPAVKVAHDEYMILSSLFRFLNEEKEFLTRISIDVLDDQRIDQVIKDLQLKNHEIYTYEYGTDDRAEIDHIISHHKKHWQDGKIDYVFTTFRDVSEQLNELGIPNRLMCTPILNMKQALEKCKSIVKLNHSVSTQIVTGYIRFKQRDQIIENEGKANFNKYKEELFQIMDRFAHKTYASIITNDRDDYVLFGTRGVLDHISKHYRDFPLLQEIEETLNTPVDIGFGLGLTAKQAETHAKLALDICRQSPKSSCYIMNDRQETIGPLGVKKHVNTAKLYRDLIHKARLNNDISYNFIDFITLRNNEPFSSHDVATYYRVTKRSAERTIKKLLSGEVIKIVGEEKPYLRGRPRKLYKVIS